MEVHNTRTRRMKAELDISENSRFLCVHIPLRSKCFIEISLRAHRFLGDTAETVRAGTDVM